MNYRSVEDLNRTLAAGTGAVPGDIDLVVGIPRSGLLAANLLALHLNLPLADVDGFLEGRVLGAGSRIAEEELRGFLETPRTVLVLDDSILTGREMERTRRRVEAAGLPHRVTYGAVFANPATQDRVDVWFELVPQPRVFEWNILHGPWIAESCVDIDGVLCPDPTDEENDDAEGYRRFLRTAPRLHAVTGPVGWLVTNRLEKYRDETERWLQARGIEYRELVMLDLPDAATRRRLAPYAPFKADVYRRTGAHIFIESDPGQAEEIAARAGRSVYCIGTRRMVDPPLRTRLPRWLARAPGRLAARVRALPARILSRATGR